MATQATLKVKAIHQETADAISLVFDVPQNLKEAFNFEAGQYITINTTLEGNKIKRAYSLCTAPHEDLLQVVIKRITGGTFSVYATAKIKVGDTFVIGSPEGRFMLKTDATQSKKYLGFAAGSGITPLFSMVKTVLHNEPESTFTLVYGNKTSKDTIFYKKLNELAANKPRFQLQYVFSQSNEADALFGRIDASIVNLMLNKGNYDAFYICGPEAMTHTIKDTLIVKNYSENSIHYELFSAKTKTADQKVNTAITGDVTLTVVLDDETETLKMNPKDTVLKGALDHNIDAPYSCQGGICSSCICKVTEGKVKLLKNEILTDVELADGLTLACQAIPETATVTINFDDL